MSVPGVPQRPSSRPGTHQVRPIFCPVWQVMRSVSVEWAIGLDTLIREMAPFTQLFRSLCDTRPSAGKRA